MELVQDYGRKKPDSSKKWLNMKANNADVLPQCKVVQSSSMVLQLIEFPQIHPEDLVVPLKLTANIMSTVTGGMVEE